MEGTAETIESGPQVSSGERSYFVFYSLMIEQEMNPAKFCSS